MDKTPSNQNTSRKEYYEKNPIDGIAFKNLVNAGLTWLLANQQTVNALNVFPVPDGDTGTNMVLTLQSASDEVAGSEEKSLEKMASMIAHGALMGARGNSGVISSQLWRGIAKGLQGYEILSSEALVKAFNFARDTAYKGVVRPVEGTMLTVAKDTAVAVEAAEKETQNLYELLNVAVNAAAKSVENTPNLLPILKEANVVDSGGKGLFYILEGMLKWINEEDLSNVVDFVEPIDGMMLDHTLDAVEEGQDWELVIDFKPFSALDLGLFYSELETMGTSIQIGEGDDMYRMHIHVPDENRTKPWDYIMTLGTISDIRIENLMIQVPQQNKEETINCPQVKPDEIAIVTVAPGIGIGNIFASLGANAVIAGGQTMNPSTQQIVEAFENLPTNKIIILPNNKNIIMAAESAAEVSTKDVRVIKSKTIPQGFAAMMYLHPDGDINQVETSMIEAIGTVETGEVTTAVRDVEIDGVQVKENEIITLLNGKLISSTKNLEEAVFNFMNSIEIDEYELITLFYGENVDKSTAEEIAYSLEEKFDDFEVDLQYGGQPHYQFIISVE